MSMDKNKTDKLLLSDGHNNKRVMAQVAAIQFIKYPQSFSRRKYVLGFDGSTKADRV